MLSIYCIQQNSMETIREVFPSFDTFRVIGRGGFATVYSATHRKIRKTVAIKHVQKSVLDVDRNRENFQYELEIMQKIDHPFICPFYEVKETADSFYLVMELASHGTLLSLLNKKRRLPQQECQRIFAQTASAIMYFHTVLNSVHRDIKIDNLLFDQYMNVRLIDFGLSKTLSDDRPVLHTLCGSYPYAAPEIFKKEPYGKAVDIWSFGICLFAMAFGYLPFDDTNTSKLMRKIVKTEPEYPKDAPEVLIDLLTKMLCKDPQNRITIEEIAKHPFISNEQLKVYFDKRFIEPPLFSVSPVIGSGLDPDVAMTLKSIGYDPMKSVKEGTEEWIIYRILRKEKVAKYASSPRQFIPREIIQKKKSAPVIGVRSSHMRELGLGMHSVLGSHGKLTKPTELPPIEKRNPIGHERSPIKIPLPSVMARQAHQPKSLIYHRRASLHKV